MELELALDRYYAVAARTFADARRGDIVLYEDSYRNVAIAINGGNASEMFGVKPGRASCGSGWSCELYFSPRNPAANVPPVVWRPAH